jgi:hypothetical protein
MVDDDPSIDDDASEQEARRAFLLRCGRFAAVTPPAITTLLTVASIPKEAHASTIGRHSGKKKGKKTGWFG